MDAIEIAREVLRATVMPRVVSEYDITTPEGTITMRWTDAMACAQKSIRNGATITPEGAGAFTLTSSSGARSVRFAPSQKI
jgi:hypothetical protein